MSAAGSCRQLLSTTWEAEEVGVRRDGWQCWHTQRSNINSRNMQSRHPRSAFGFHETPHIPVTSDDRCEDLITSVLLLITHLWSYYDGPSASSAQVYCPGEYQNLWVLKPLLWKGTLFAQNLRVLPVHVKSHLNVSTVRTALAGGWWQGKVYVCSVQMQFLLMDTFHL